MMFSYKTTSALEPGVLNKVNDLSLLHKIAVGKYTVNGDSVIVAISDTLSCVIPIAEIENRIKSVPPDYQMDWELEFFSAVTHKYTDYKKGLNRYLKDAFTRGSLIQDKRYYKAYFPSENDWDHYRRNCSNRICSFIDYESQIKETGLIKDVPYGDGLYASITKLPKPDVVGDHLMVIAPIPGERYILNQTQGEIIGDSFKVMDYHIPLKKINRDDLE